jgi:hypothetical protein
MIPNARKGLHLNTERVIILPMKIAINIRIPKEMKKALDKIAEDEFRSTNSVILQFLDEKLKSKEIDWRSKGQKSKT